MDDIRKVGSDSSRRFFSVSGVQTVLQCLVFAPRIPVVLAVTVRHRFIKTNIVLQKGMVKSTLSGVTSYCKKPDEVNRSTP